MFRALYRPTRSSNKLGMLNLLLYQWEKPTPVFGPGCLKQLEDVDCHRTFPGLAALTCCVINHQQRVLMTATWCEQGHTFCMVIVLAVWNLEDSL
ncbi:hypothetical protein D3C84_1050710 [compost metagenome]